MNGNGTASQTAATTNNDGRGTNVLKMPRWLGRTVVVCRLMKDIISLGCIVIVCIRYFISTHTKYNKIDYYSLSGGRIRRILFRIISSPPDFCIWEIANLNFIRTHVDWKLRNRLCRWPGVGFAGLGDWRMKMTTTVNNNSLCIDQGGNKDDQASQPGVRILRPCCFTYNAIYSVLIMDFLDRLIGTATDERRWSDGFSWSGGEFLARKFQRQGAPFFSLNAPGTTLLPANKSFAFKYNRPTCWMWQQWLWLNELNSGPEVEGKEEAANEHKKLVSFFVKGNLIFSPVHSAWMVQHHKPGRQERSAVPLMHCCFCQNATVLVVGLFDLLTCRIKEREKAREDFLVKIVDR